MELRQNSILITGASGFVGSNLLKSDAAKHFKETQIWDRQKMGTLLKKVNRESQLNLLKPEIVIHLAWASTNRERYELQKDNLRWGDLTVDFARECMERNIRFITVGSAIEDSLSELSGRTPYAAAKNRLHAELILEPLVNYISYLKPSYIFSLEHQRPRLLRDFIYNRENALQVIKNPSKNEEFIHIDDVIFGLTLIIENDLRGIFELGGGMNASVSDFVNVVSLNLGSEIIYPWTAQGFKPVRSNSLLYSLGWRSIMTTRFFNIK